MKKMNRKGFTIVELVIVIAVIAILAGVLIPTFSGIIDKANDSAITQETRAALTSILVEKNGDLTGGEYFFKYTKGNDTKQYKYDTATGGLKEDTTTLTVTVADTIYTSNVVTTGEGESATSTITPDIFEAADPETEGNVTKNTTIVNLSDLSSNVEVLFVPASN